MGRIIVFLEFGTNCRLGRIVALRTSSEYTDVHGLHRLNSNKKDSFSAKHCRCQYSDKKFWVFVVSGDK